MNHLISTVWKIHFFYISIGVGLVPLHLQSNSFLVACCLDYEKRPHNEWIKYHSMLRRWSPQQNICSSWIFLLLLVCFAIQPILLVLLLRDTSSTKVGSPNQTPFFGSNEMNEQQDSLSSSKYQLKRGSSLVCTNTTDVNHRFCRYDSQTTFSYQNHDVGSNEVNPLLLC